MPAFMARFLFVASTAVCCARADKPGLPSVDLVLTKANSKAHDFAQQAAAMQQKLVEQQAKSRAALHEKKEEYEQLLQAQSNQSLAIKRKIDELQSGNSKLSQSNTEMMTHLQTLAGRNRELRDTLQEITSKVSTAQLFLADSLNITDDSTAKELEILIPSTPKPTLDHFLAMTSSDKVSLLAVQAKRRGGGPEELVSMLADSLADIKTAEQEGAADLKAHFMQSFSEGEKHQAELNETVAALNETQATLKETRAKLLDAKAHLEATSTSLHERLRAVRTFATTVEGAVGASLHGEETKTANSVTVAANVTKVLMATNASVNASTANTTLEQKPQAPPATLLRTNSSALINASAATATPPATRTAAVTPAVSKPAPTNAAAVAPAMLPVAAKPTQAPAAAQVPVAAKPTQASVAAKPTQAPVTAKKTLRTARKPTHKESLVKWFSRTLR